jgi:hypothetical protein
LDRVFRWTEELNALPPEQHSIIFIFGAHAWHSEVYRILGDYPRALAASRQMEEWAQGSYPLALAWLKANHVRDLVASGSLDEAQAKLAEAYRENLKDYSGFGPILVRAADIELALARANPEHAIVVANSLLADLERLKIKFYRANVYCLRGKARMAQNAWDAAADDFSLADAFGKLLPARRILWETYALWSQVEQRRGKFALAAELAAQAREYALFIADHAGSAQGRALFLSHPSVQALLDPAGTQTL